MNSYKTFLTLFGLLAFLCTQLCFGQQTPDSDLPLTQEQYSRAKIYTNDLGLMELGALGVEIDHGEYKKGVWFASDFSASDLKKIAAAGFSFDIIHEDVAAHYTSKNRTSSHSHSHGHSHQHSPTKKAGCNAATDGGVGDYPVPSDFELGDMGGFFTYQEMLDHLDNMATKYPHLISSRAAIGTYKTYEDNVLYWVKISDSPNIDEDEPEVLYTALHHAREPMSLSQTIYYMYYLLENYETDEEIKFLVDNTEMYFIPCINPDGYEYNQQIRPNGGGLWRRNKRDNNNNGTFSPQTDGVDLNRNYDLEWGRDDFGSSPDPTSDTYRGPSAASEPETQAVQFFCERHDFKIAQNYHAFSNLLIYPWGYVADFYTPDSALYVNYAQIMTQENGYAAGTGNQTVGYLVNGDSDDWMYGEQTTKNKIFAFTPEVGNSDDGFWPASNRIIPLCQENVWTNIVTSLFVHNYAKIEDKSPLFVTDSQMGFSFELTRLGLEDGVPFTVSIEPTNDAITSVGAAQNYTLALPMEMVEGSFAYELRSDIEAGESIEFDLIIDNNQGRVERTSITKYFGAPVLAFEDNADDMEAWSGSGWGLSSTEFYSSSTSITDSPNGNYPPDIRRELLLDKEIDLSDSNVATLTFWAKWEIETNFDYVQLYAINSETGIETPLCGNYTTMGNSYLDSDQPLYDGIQSDWVQEEISLNDFIGQKIQLRFLIWSDSFVEGDGFYFDDLQVSKIGGIETSIEDFKTNPNILLSQNSPNPTNGETTFNFQLPATITASVNLVTYNSLGQAVTQQSVAASQEGKVLLKVNHLESGIYFSRLESEEGSSNVVRVMVVR
ncbi:MAG: M14 family zinc carboxypeptidase [Chitinophagales bacterium]